MEFQLNYLILFMTLFESFLCANHSIAPFNTSSSQVITAVPSTEIIPSTSTTATASPRGSPVTTATTFHSYDNYLKFDVNAVVNSSYSEELKNIKRFSNHLDIKFQQIFATNNFVTSSLNNTSNAKSSLKIRAFLYFNTNTTLDAKQIQSALEDDVFYSSVIVTEVCAANTCGSDGTCLSNNASCSCKYGFRGRRCDIKYSVNGSRYGEWSHWTPCSKTCGGGLRKRFSWCAPTPVHDGWCLLSPSSRVMNESCNEKSCSRDHADEDYYLVAYICGGILLLILLLLIAFCCTAQTNRHGKRPPVELNNYKSSYKPKTSETPSIDRHATSSDRYATQYIDAGNNQMLNVMPLHSINSENHELVNNNAFDNKAYRDYDEMSESEQIYRDQIQKFLQQAPDIRYNVVVPRSPRVKRERPRYDQVLQTSSPLPKPRSSVNKNSKPTETPSKKLADINAKIVEHGPSKYKLVLI